MTDLDLPLIDTHQDIVTGKCKGTGCGKQLPFGSKWGYCYKCLGSVRYYVASTHTRGGGQVSAFNADEVADIVKRIRAFENPKHLAKEYGVTVRTVLNAAKPGYNPAPEKTDA